MSGTVIPKKTLIAPSLLSANFGKLASEIAGIQQDGADWLHIDVMDGTFVPPITFGDNMVATAKQHSTLPLDVHLMIVDPDKHYESFKAAGATGITIHVEATKDPASSLKKIRDLGLKAGITLKPATSISEVEPLLDICDLALIMTVNPGWSGQKFMPEGLKKIERLKQIISAKNLTTLIEVDGGINHDTARMCVSAGADVLVAGSYIFGASDRKAAINSLK